MSIFSTRNKTSPKRIRRSTLIAIIAVAIIAVAGITVISRQNSAGNSRVATESSVTGQKISTNNARTRTFVTRRVGGQEIQIDSQTGEIKPLTPEEAQKLANGLAPMLDRSTDGLVQVKHADGSVSMDLQGRFKDVAIEVDGGARHVFTMPQFEYDVKCNHKHQHV